MGAGKLEEGRGGTTPKTQERERATVETRGLRDDGGKKVGEDEIW